MATIYLVRHGQASFGQDNYDKLSPIGEQQALFTGEWLKRAQKPLSRFGCGTLVRQRQTLAGIYSGMGLEGDQSPNHILPGLNELDVDDIVLAANPAFSSRKALDLHVSQQSSSALAFFHIYREALARWAMGEHDGDYQETWGQFKERTLQSVIHVAEQLNGQQNALLVSSGGVIATLMLQVLGIPDGDAFKLNRHIHNTSITTLEYRKGTLSLHGFNNYAHLEQLGERKLLTRI